MKEKKVKDLCSEVGKLSGENFKLLEENAKLQFQIKCLLETIKILQER